LLFIADLSASSDFFFASWNTNHGLIDGSVVTHLFQKLKTPVTFMEQTVCWARPVRLLALAASVQSQVAALFLCFEEL
jgi:hypothetical protein